MSTLRPADVCETAIGFFDDRMADDGCPNHDDPYEDDAVFLAHRFGPAPAAEELPEAPLGSLSLPWLCAFSHAPPGR